MTPALPTLEVVIASTRPGRVGLPIGRWFFAHAQSHPAFRAELVDLAELNLPLLDEPAHPRLQKYQHPHTRAWSAIVGAANAFVFVVPEYNHTPPPSLINAIDYLVVEWAYKPLGFVSYGGISGGLRSVQALKPMVTGLKMMPIPEAVTIPMVSKLVDQASGVFNAEEHHRKAADAMLGELARWTGALITLQPPAS
jgi:NAD(P)H-dependent FMN reductase